MNEEPERTEQQNRRGRAVNLLLNVVVLLLLGAGVWLTVEFSLQVLGQHFHI